MQGHVFFSELLQCWLVLVIAIAITLCIVCYYFGEILQVPIGGCYRLIDIPMSNCINSGIRKIFIL